MIGNVYVCVHAAHRCTHTYTHRAKSGDWQIHASLFHRADILPFNQRAQSMCFCSQSLVRDKVNILSDGLQHVISPCNGPVTAPPSKTLNFSDWIHGSTLSLLWTFDSSSVAYTRGTFFPLLLKYVVAQRKGGSPESENQFISIHVFYSRSIHCHLL